VLEVQDERSYEGQMLKAKKRNINEEDKKGGRSANTVTEGEEFAFITTFAGTTLALGMSLLTGWEVNIHDSGTSGHMHQINTTLSPSGYRTTCNQCHG
jgi:hypothetical protein